MFYAVMQTNKNIQRAVGDFAVDIYYAFFKEKDKNETKQNNVEQKIESDAVKQESDVKRAFTFGDITDTNRTSSSSDDIQHVKILKSGLKPDPDDNTKKVHIGTKNDSKEKG